MSYRVLIADDEQLARQRLKRLLAAMPDLEVVGECSDGEQVLARVRAGGIDLVLLDIQMPKLSGTEALGLWPDGGPMVVFCTAHAQHAVDAFDKGAVDYLLKPIEEVRLAKALERAKSREAQRAFANELSQQHHAKAMGRLPITTRHGVVLLDPLLVTHALLEDELVTVFTTKEKFLTDYSLQQLEARLPAGRFDRVHRRALLALEHVSRLEPVDTGGYVAHTHQGHRVEVSRQAARELRKRLGLRKPVDEADGA